MYVLFSSRDEFFDELKPAENRLNNAGSLARVSLMQRRHNTPPLLTVQLIAGISMSGELLLLRESVCEALLGTLDASDRERIDSALADVRGRLKALGFRVGGGGYVMSD